MNYKHVFAVLYRHLILFTRDFDKIVETFWWPVLDLIVWGLVTSYVTQRSGGEVNVFVFFIGAVILWSVINRSQLDIGMSFLQEAWDRNILNLFVSPMSILELLTGQLLLGVIKQIISVTILAILSIVLYSFNIFIFGWYFIPFMISLLMMGWWIGLIANALIIRYGYRVQAFAWTLVYVFQPISAVFYPVSILPEPIKTIAWFSPATYIFEGMRKILTTGDFDINYLLISFALNIIYIILGILLYKKMFDKALEKGFLTHFH